MNLKIDFDLKPTFVIFLGIDGVIYDSPKPKDVFKKVKELFPNEKELYDSRICSIAAAYFFDQHSLQNLDILISKLGKIFQIQIVISSNWRENRSVEELKNTIFGMHNFSKYIIDKTIENLDENVKNYCPDASHSKEYISYCQAADIQHWLNNHLEVKNYVIFDRDFRHLSTNFGKRFIKTNYSTLLTSELVLEALQLAQE